MEEIKPKHAGGRPKKTLDNLPKNWKQIITDIKREGGSDVEVRVALDISKDLWNRFEKEIDEFSATIKKGDDLCESWWLKNGREGIKDRTFNAVLWYMNMKNRFGWVDKTDITTKGKELPTPILGYKKNAIQRGISDKEDSGTDKED
jgi:hypothetical protein